MTKQKVKEVINKYCPNKLERYAVYQEELDNEEAAIAEHYAHYIKKRRLNKIEEN